MWQTRLITFPVQADRRLLVLLRAEVRYSAVVMAAMVPLVLGVEPVAVVLLVAETVEMVALLTAVLQVLIPFLTLVMEVEALKVPH